MQIARAMMTAADEAFDDLVERTLEDDLRTRLRNRNERARKQELRMLKKREALIGNTIAPGVPASPYMVKVLGAEPAHMRGIG